MLIKTLDREGLWVSINQPAVRESPYLEFNAKSFTVSTASSSTEEATLRDFAYRAILR
jgi:hypothetical protein